MKNRCRIPFGYEMRQGEIVPHPAESDTVQYIFAQYLAGDSLQMLAEQLNHRGVPYSDDPWTKNMVHRIITATRYCVEGKYTALIDSATQEAVRNLRAERDTRSRKKLTRCEVLRPKLVCAACGAALYSRKSMRGPIQWHCGGANCTQRGVIGDEALYQEAVTGTNWLLHNVDTINVQPGTEQKTKATFALRYQENEITRMLDMPGCDMEELRQKVLQLAALRYEEYARQDAAGDEMHFIEHLKRAIPTEQLNPALLLKTVQRIQITAQRTMQFVLPNGQMIDQFNEVKQHASHTEDSDLAAAQPRAGGTARTGATA